MGMVGTTPAAGRVLLVGDAAGLVNPLQGEGISQAMQSGRWAAEAILRGGGGSTWRAVGPAGRVARRPLPGPTGGGPPAVSAGHRHPRRPQSAVVGRPSGGGGYRPG